MKHEDMAWSWGCWVRTWGAQPGETAAEAAGPPPIWAVEAVPGERECKMMGVAPGQVGPCAWGSGVSTPGSVLRCAQGALCATFR